jgi:hypothetical protein
MRALRHPRLEEALWLSSISCMHCFRNINMFLHVLITTKPSDRVVNTPSLYSGDPGFKSRPGDQLSLLRISVDFLSPRRYYLKLSHNSFFQQPFPFIIYLSSSHSTLYCMSYWESVAKLQITPHNWTRYIRTPRRILNNSSKEICRRTDLVSRYTSYKER